MHSSSGICYTAALLNSLAGLPKLHIITGRGHKPYADVIDLLVIKPLLFVTCARNMLALYALNSLPKVVLD